MRLLRALQTPALSPGRDRKFKIEPAGRPIIATAISQFPNSRAKGKLSPCNCLQAGPRIEAGAFPGSGYDQHPFQYSETP